MLNRGRDKEYFTTHRILIEDGKGIGSKRKNFKSIAYSTIIMFSVQTAGGGIDRDAECTVWNGHLKASISFSKSKVDIFDVYQLLNVKISIAKLKGTPDFVDPTPPNMDKK